MIATLYGLQINEFVMIIRSNQIDPDTDDDTYIKDVQGMFNQVTIKANKHYHRNLHPKYLISQNERYFNTVFALLRDQNVDAATTELVWALITRLPVNQSLHE
jgi:hypothetical protein